MEHIVNNIGACQADDARKTSRARHCLNCGDLFPSEGVFNRICAGCKASESWDGIGDHVLHRPAARAERGE